MLCLMSETKLIRSLTAMPHQNIDLREMKNPPHWVPSGTGGGFKVQIEFYRCQGFKTTDSRPNEVSWIRSTVKRK